MSDQPSLLHQIQHTYGELQADAVEILAARTELAQLELRLSKQRASRTAKLVAVCLLLAATGFVMLVHLAADHLTALFGLSQSATLGLVGGVLLVFGLGIAALSIRTFLHKYRHFEQTAAEFQADLHAVSSWLHRDQTSV